MTEQRRKETGEKFVKYLSKAVSPFQTVDVFINELTTNGYVLLNEDELLKNSKSIIKAGGKYIVHRNHSAVLAFSVPEGFSPSDGAFVIAAGHSDSPCLRVRPKSDQTSMGLLQLGCETYGGGLWHTWFDRELSLAGRVLVRGDSGIEEKLVNIERPIVMIPNLAIHLQTAEERASFVVDKEEHLRPILATATKTDADESGVPVILSVVAKEIGVKPEQIIDMDLSLYDATAPRVWGINEEFIASGRIDNQSSNYAGLEAMKELKSSKDICGYLAFDHEEVGSRTWVGADSDLLLQWMTAISRAFSVEDMAYTINNSFLISSDVAHAVHPNYVSKHQVQHQIKCGEGVVIKSNENARYTSNGLSRAMARELGKEYSVRIQDVMVKNSSPCGSTIGPLVSSNLSIRAIDVGIPQWAMHSVRESCHIDDVNDLKNLFLSFFEQYRMAHKNFKPAH